MSMNLNLKINGRKFDLWQTPTQITYIIMADRDGIQYELEGNAALDAMGRYIQWVDQSANGSWTDERALKSRKDAIKGHIKDIEHALGFADTVKVYIT